MKKLVNLPLALLLCCITLPAECPSASSPLQIVKAMLSQSLSWLTKHPKPSKEPSEQEQLEEQLKKEWAARMDAISRGIKAAARLVSCGNPCISATDKTQNSLNRHR